MTGKRIFISIGLREGDGFEPFDKVVLLQMLRTIGGYAEAHNHTLIVRDHPAMTGLLEAMLGEGSKQIAVVPPDMEAVDIALRHQPDLVFYFCGEQDVLQDYRDLRGYSAIGQVPFRSTGGAASVIDKAMNHDRTLHPALAATREDIWGFEALHKIMVNIGPDLPNKPPRGPSL